MAGMVHKSMRPSMWSRLFLVLAMAAACFSGVNGFSAQKPLSVRQPTFKPDVASTRPQANSFGGALSKPSSVTMTQLHHSSGVSEVVSSIPIINALVTSAPFWSALIMSSLVALLFTWESTIKLTREKLPKTLMPVLDSMLAEMGGLGFIGLFLSVVVTGGPLGTIVGDLSEEFLGDEDILLETFEFLHAAFFEVAIVFFIVAGAVVARLISQIECLQKFSLAIFDIDDDGDVSVDELAEFLNVEAVVVDQNGDGVLDDDEIAAALRTVPKTPLWKEVFMSPDQVRAETLVVRERFVNTCRVLPNFKIENYFVPIFGKNLQEVVELSPLIWLPLIPAISIGRAVDMSRDVVSAASTNAYESCGNFIADPLFFPVTCVVAISTLAWGIWNFWKMTSIKQMLLPTLVKDVNAPESKAALLPPRYEDKGILEEFNSSPNIVGWIESFYAKPARHEHEKLFGLAGAAGPELYLNSIKFQTWVVVSQIVFWGLQIVARDMQALLEGWQVADVGLVKQELAVFSTFVAVCVAQLALAPQTFLNYCLVTSIEKLVDEYVIDDALCAMKDEKEVVSYKGEENAAQKL